VIVTQTEEAERVIGMMNKNLPAFLYHMLLELDFMEDIIKYLLKNSCEASLVADIPNCKWQSGVRTMMTLADERQEKAVKALESTAWFKDEFGLLKKGPKAQPCLLPEEQFNLDNTSLVKTIHDRHQSPILKNAPNAPKKGNKGEINLTHKKNASNEPKKGNEGEIGLTHEEETKGDSPSQSSSSSLEDSDGSSNYGSCSKTSININEEMSTANCG
jgi:hypothetical protein